MKLVKSLVVATLGSMFLFACSSTDTGTTDAGDAAKVDTGTAETPPADTGTAETPADTATGPTKAKCNACITASCKTEFDACDADTACKVGITCLNACPEPDVKNACANKCITDLTANAKFQALADCLGTKCKLDCFEP